MSREKCDVLAAEVSIDAGLSESGVRLHAKSRTLAALDRLGGNAVDIFGSYLERIRDGVRITTDTKRELLRIDSDAAVRRFEASDLAGDRALRSFHAELLLKQSNRDAVGMDAVEHLVTSPPTAEENANEETISDDWMNVFANHAENASSDNLRELWGKILAGEIRKPGSFSLTTLRVISELDKSIAEKFEHYARARGVDGTLINLADGELLKDFSFLEEVGLISGVGGLFGRQLTLAGDGKMYVRDENLLLIISPLDPTNRLRIPVLFLTRVGREIAEALVPRSSEDYLRNAALKLDRKKVSSASIGTFVPIGDGSQGQIANLRKIY